MIRIFLSFSIALVLFSCNKAKKTTALEESTAGIAASEVYDLMSYRVQFTPTLVINGMPGTNSDPYLILKLTEIEGKNIQSDLAIDNVVLEYNGKKQKIEISEMHDFGSDSPILEGVVRNLGRDVSRLDIVTIHFFEINSLKEHTLSVKNLNSTIAY
jgi:hypothetical protein